MAKKKKGIIKKVAIGATILLGLVGITYTAVPKVREVVNETIDKIVDTITQGERNNLKELDIVRNIKFDEKTSTLTFDENLEAAGYLIQVEHKGTTAYELRSPAGVVSIPGAIGVVSGDEINFKVIALGDGINTKDSKEVEYSYTFQTRSEDYYREAYNNLQKVLDKASGYSVRGDLIADLELVAFNLDGDNFIIEATGNGRGKTPINITLTYDLKDFGFSKQDDFTDVLKYIDFMVQLETKMMVANVDIKVESRAESVNMFDIVENGGAFEEYTNQGYSVELLTYTSSKVLVEEGKSYVLFEGIYKATHGSKESITFKQENKISIESEKNYMSMSEFVQDALTEGVVSQESKEEFNNVLNHQYEKSIEAYQNNNKTKTSTSSMDREQ